MFGALAAAINILGGILAFGLRLPIYLDMIGTLFVAVALGPGAAVATAVISALVNGMYDIYAVYFMPVALIGGWIAGMIFKWRPAHWTKKTPLELYFIAPSTIVASMIAAQLFGGQTSSGSSVIAQFLNKMGLNLISSVFLTRIATDYADRLISIVIVFLLLQKIPRDLLDVN